jgi:hypothetical protein
MNMNVWMEQLQWATRRGVPGDFVNETPVEEVLDHWDEAGVAASFYLEREDADYDAIDRRLMDTFPASDAVARF